MTHEQIALIVLVAAFAGVMACASGVVILCLREWEAANAQHRAAMQARHERTGR